LYDTIFKITNLERGSGSCSFFAEREQEQLLLKSRTVEWSELLLKCLELEREQLQNLRSG
jgi:hypothetical protein